jgi:hypothetical protein
VLNHSIAFTCIGIYYAIRVELECVLIRIDAGSDRTEDDAGPDRHRPEAERTAYACEVGYICSHIQYTIRSDGAECKRCCTVIAEDV